MSEEQVTVEKDHRYHNSMEEILALIKARVPIIWVLTHEEGRFVEDFVSRIAEPHQREVWLWSVYQGLIRQDQELANQGLRAKGEEADTWNPMKAIYRFILKVKMN